MLTKRQKEVLDFIREYTAKYEYAPSLEEIKKHFKLASVSTAHYHINKLQKEGYLNKESNQPRAISVRSSDFSDPLPRIASVIDSISIPVIGMASCGVANMVAEENIDAYLKIPSRLLNKKDGVFAVRADGNSMNRANINNKNIESGDFVVIDSENRSAKDGDYVLSIIDGCANLKKFKSNRESGSIMLVPESTDAFHKPIYVSSQDDFMINGKIIDVIKK